MALARKCDRCFNFYSEDQNNSVRPSASGITLFKVITEGKEPGDIIDEKYDLCPQCANAFFEFMNPFGHKEGDDDK